MKDYQVPKADATPEGYKYSLVYIRDGRRLVGYDNHERKGDHRHYGRQITPYRFTSIEQLTEDFLHDVATVKKEMEI